MCTLAEPLCFQILDNYSRLRQAPQAIRDEWARVQKSGDRSEFVKAVLAVQQGDYSGIKVTSVRSFENEHEDGDLSEWLSWTQMVRQEGEECVRAYLRAGTVNAVPNPKLPAEGSGIAWPMNLVFWWKKEQVINKKREKDGFSMHDPTLDLRQDEAEQMAQAMSTRSRLGATRPVGGLGGSAARSASGGSASNDDPGDGTPRGEDKASKAALDQLRKCHGEWDRKRREFQKSAVQAEQCSATKGTPYLTRLKETVLDGGKVDAELESFEIKCASAPADDKDVAAMADLCTQLVNIMKVGQKYSASLKATMKVESDL